MQQITSFESYPDATKQFTTYDGNLSCINFITSAVGSSHVSSLPEPCPVLLDVSSLTDWLDSELDPELNAFRVSL